MKKEKINYGELYQLPTPGPLNSKRLKILTEAIRGSLNPNNLNLDKLEKEIKSISYKLDLIIKKLSED
jgi:hypothetical protein